MKKILKKTPITLMGVDYNEILVEDDSLGEYTACDLCLYSGFPSFDLGLMASCMDVHGCTRYDNRYFLIEPILANK